MPVKRYDSPASFDAAERAMLLTQETPIAKEAAVRRLSKQVELSRRPARITD